MSIAKFPNHTDVIRSAFREIGKLFRSAMWDYFPGVQINAAGVSR
jgi:hypothetical protein